MRAPLRSFATLLLGVAVATCSDAPLASVRTGPGTGTKTGIGVIGLAPSFTESARYAAQHAADFPSITYTTVRILIRGNPDTTQIVKDTTITFTPTTPDVSLDLVVPVQSDGQRFNAAIDYQNGSDVVFHGAAVVQSYPPTGSAPPSSGVVVTYVGAGSQAQSLAVSPKTFSLNGTGSTTLSATAKDAAGNAVSAPLAWSSSDPTIATVDVNGVVRAQNKRGSVTITASTPTGLNDAATGTVTLSPSAIVVVSGAGQTGKIGATLPNPAVVQVNAVDGAGVSGVTVAFGAPAGGSVGSTTAVTDANGRASTTLKLGTAVGTQNFAASAAGFNTTIAETATAGDPAAMTIVSGNSQKDTVRATLAPLSVKVVDASNNPVSGATVTWTRTSGGGTLGAPTSTTGADGVATNTYKLGSTAGSETVTAAAGPATAAFTFTASAGGASTIAIVSGDAQTGAVATLLPSPLVVRVSDVAGNPVANVAVLWAATNGTLAVSGPTDSTGVASATLTLGTTLGAATATASLGNRQQVTFTATATVGAPTKLAFTTQPANTQTGSLLAPVRVSVMDVANDVVPNSSASITLAIGSNPGSGTLAGTVTRQAVNGVATFDDLKLDRVGNGYTLVATTGGLTSATSTAFNVAAGSAGAPTTMQLVGPSSVTAVAGTTPTQLPSLQVTDVNGIPVPNVPITIVVMRGTQQIFSGVQSTGTDGSLSVLSLVQNNTTAGTFTITFTAAGLAGSPATFTAIVTPAAAAKLMITNKAQLQTAIVPGSPLNPQPQLQLVDQYQNPVPSGTMTVTATSLSTNTTIGGGTQITLGPTTGAGAFTSLSLAGTGATRIAFASSGGTIAGDTTGLIQLSSPSATQLLLAGGPSPSIEAFGTSPTLTVTAKDASQNTATSTTGSVTLTLLRNGSAASGIVGTLTQPFVNGVATFSDLSFTSPATNYTISASHGTLAPVQTSSFTVTVAPVLANVNGPFNVVPGTVVTPKVRVTVNGTPVQGRGIRFSPVSNGGSIGTGAIQFPGSQIVVTDANGEASIAWATPSAAGATTLSAGLVTSSLSTSFSATLVSGATQLILVPDTTRTFTKQAGGSVPNAPAIKVADANGNGVSNVGVRFVTTQLTSTVKDTTLTSDGSGLIAGASIATPDVPGTYTITASVPSLASIPSQSVTLNVTAAVPALIKLFGGNGQTGTVNTALATAPSVVVVDASNNPVQGVAVTFTASGTGSVTPTSVVTTDASGIAALTSWKLGTTAGAQTLTASATGLASVTFNATANAGAAAKLIFLSSAPTTALTRIHASTMAVGVADAFGNRLTSGTGTTDVVTLTATHTGPGSLLNPTATATAGEADFFTLDFTDPDTYVVHATASPSGLQSTSDLSVTVSAGPILQIVNGTLSATPGSVVTPQVHVTLNGSPLAGTQIEFGPSQTLGTATLNGTGVAYPNIYPPVTTDANGNASISWTVPNTNGTYNLSTAIHSSSIVGTFTATVVSGANGITLSSVPATVTNDATFSTAPQAQLVDVTNAPIATAGVVVTATINEISHTSSVGGRPGAQAIRVPDGGARHTLVVNGSGTTMTATTDSTGKATFTGMKVTGALSDFTITFSATVSSNNLSKTSSTITMSPGVAKAIYVAPADTLIREVAGGLFAYPAARVQDISGNDIPGSTVNYSTASPCSLAGSGTVTTGVGGFANIDDQLITVPNVEKRSCALTLSSPLSGVSSRTVRFVVGASTGLTWTGQSNNVWSNQFNWRTTIGGFAAPTASDAVFIPKNGATSPVLGADASAASIEVEDQGSVDLGTHTLTVKGTVDANPSGSNATTGSITNGTLTLDATGATTVRGSLPATVIGNGTSCGGSYSLAGNSTASSVVLNCSLSIGGSSLVLAGNFSTAGAHGALKMTNAAGLVDVNGTSTFAGASLADSLTAGTFEARGNFVQQSTVSSSSYAPSGQHKTSLWGGSNQTVSFADATNSYFWDVEVKNAGITAEFLTAASAKNDFTITSTSGTAQATFDQTFSVTRNFTASANTKVVSTGSGKRIIVGGAVTGASTADLGGVDSLRVTGSTFPSYANTTAGKAPKVTQLTGAVQLTNASQTVAGGLSISGGGNLDLHGKALTVTDSVIVTGVLRFPATSIGNSLTVGGLFKIDGGTVNPQAGTLAIAGDFNESGTATTAFAPSAGFLTTFNGTSAQSISFSHPGSSSSNFRGLKVTNASGATFTTAGFVKDSLVVDVGGSLLSNSGIAITAEDTVISRFSSHLIGVAELIVTGSKFPGFAGSSTPAKVTIAHDMTMGSDATLTGQMSVQKALTVGGHKLIVNGDFAVEGSDGLLRVAQSADSVVVGGNATFSGASQDFFPFSAGAFEFKGNFTASGTKTFYPSSYVANTARFTGTGTQTISISGTDNFFGNVLITNASTNGVAMTGSTSIGGVFNQNGAFTMTSGTLTIPGTVNFGASSKTNVNAAITVTGTANWANGAIISGNNAGNITVSGSCVNGGYSTINYFGTITGCI